ncbi:hypothetical protein [Streptomyces sp. NPDC014006]
MTTTATRTAGGYRLNGQKAWISTRRRRRATSPSRRPTRRSAPAA